MMKVLKAKTLHPKKKIFNIADLYYVKHGLALKEILDGEDMIDPIEIIKHQKSEVPRMGANGVKYIEKDYTVLRGSRRITAALQLGYTHIEGIITND